MPQLIYGLFWFVRLGPIGLGIAAVAILGAGYFLQIEMNKSDAAKAAALAAGPPASVDVAKFDAGQHATDLREVVIRGQAVMDFGYELTIEKDTGDSEGFMLPLVSETASNETEVVGIVFFHERGFRFDRLTPEFLMNGLVGFGDVGPVMEYNGKISSLGTWEDLTRQAFAQEGLVFSDDLVVVWPFIDGREVAFAPPKEGELTAFGVLSKIAGAIGLLALAKLVLAKKPDDTPLAPPAVDPVAQNVTPQFEPIPDTSGVPLWKQRAGLVGEADVVKRAPVPAAQISAKQAAPLMTNAPLMQPRKRRFGVRKVLIGIVGGLFLLGLAAVVSDLVAQSSPAETAVTVTSSKEALAASAADIVVPDADPNRHWTDIDVTPVIEWFVAKALLAAAGDTDAIMVLGMVIGGVFVAMFMIRYFFLMRRALAPKTSARFDSMGLN